MCVRIQCLPSIVYQVWVLSWVLGSIIAQGMLFGFTPGLLSGLRAPDSTIQVDLNTASWLAASLGIAGAVGNPVATALMHYYGRRNAFFLSYLPGIFGIATIYFATDAKALMVGRILGGLTQGGSSTIGLIIIGEYSSPKHRGMFLNLKAGCVSLGSALAHILGHFYHWRIVAALILALNILILLSILTWCESPAWLASRERFDECEKIFKLLKGEDELAKQELETLLQLQKELIAASPKQMSILKTIGGLCRKFTKGNFLRPLFINLISVILLEAAGRYIFPTYALQIICEITGESANGLYYALCIDFIVTISSMISSLLVKKINRRTLILFSGIFGILALIVMCPYLYLTSANIITIKKPWIPITMLVVFFSAINIGCVPVVLGLAGETYPFEHRAFGSAVYGTFLGLSTMVGLKSFPYMLLYIKIYGTFAVLGLIIGIALVSLYYLLPETKDKTLEEIEGFFDHGRFGHRSTKREVEKILGY